MKRENVTEIYRAFENHPLLSQFIFVESANVISLIDVDTSRFYKRVNSELKDRNENKFTLNGIINNWAVGDHGSGLMKSMLGTWDSLGRLSIRALVGLARRDEEIAKLLDSTNAQYSAVGTLETYGENKVLVGVRPILLVPELNDNGITAVDRWESSFERKPHTVYGLYGAMAETT